MRYEFNWDRKKAHINKIKHKVSFEDASTIFNDSNSLTIYDYEHRDEEDRWITMGLDHKGKFIVLVHTFDDSNHEKISIRMISARKATKKEIKTYGDRI